MGFTFTFFPEAGAWGPTNNLLGIADVLRRRGHRCVFNAQRADETGFGVRLATHAFAEEELTGAVGRLLADEPLHRRMAGIATRLQANPGTERAADLIERIARERRPVTR